MDYTILANLLWDAATGISVGLLAYGAWLCAEYRFVGDNKEERDLTAPGHLILN